MYGEYRNVRKQSLRYRERTRLVGILVVEMID